MIKVIQIISVVLALNGYLLAQLDEDDLKQRIIQFQSQLTRLQSLTERYNNQQASNILMQAKKWFEEARESWQARKYREARVQFSEATRLLYQASRLLFYKPVLNMQNTLEEAIHRVEISLQKNNSRDVRYLLNKAREFQLKANRQLNLSDYVKGQEYLRIALHFARKAADLSEKTGDETIARFNYEEDFQNLQDLYRELYRSNSDNRQVNELLQKADSYLRKSKNLFGNNDERQAFLQLQIAEKLLFRAVDLADKKLENRSQRFMNNINSLRQYLNGIELSINYTDDIKARNFYNKASQLLAESENDYKNGRLDKAATKLLLAQRLANRALRFSDQVGNGETTQIKNRIDEIDRIIQLQKQKIEINDNKVINNLHKEAETLLQKARSKLESNDEEQAFQYIQLALRLVNRIDILIQRKNMQSQPAVPVDAEIQNLENELNTLHRNTDANETMHTRIQMLKALLKKAKNHYENEEIETTLELIRIIQSQLKLILDQARA